ncbi:MAG: hypothetical protein CSA82_00320 [Actinobacteria bacterium]|nr:MAG: hypothetical protein CSA82_00320 [Actinomycetota bacterium]
MTSSTVSLRSLHEALSEGEFGLTIESSQEGKAAATRALRILDDHVFPRLDALEAPILCVLGGSTGAGKSTLLNSLLREKVSASSVVRPTTRQPLLVHRPEDSEWFLSSSVLPSLGKKRLLEASSRQASESTAQVVELFESDSLPEGLALLDAPDLDSVVDTNREMARQLFDTADLWVFVTTAARYADAIPWETLSMAGRSGVVVAVVLNRVPPGAHEAVSEDLRRLLGENGLSEAPLFTVEEQTLEDELLPREAVSLLDEWLRLICENAQARAEIAHKAVMASLGEVVDDSQRAIKAFEAETEVYAEGQQALDEAQEKSLERIRVATADGTLLRGEVLARWYEIVGAADLTRSLGRGVAFLRDRVTHYLTGKPAPVVPVEDALEEGLAELLADELMRTRDDVTELWHAHRGLRELIPDTEKNADIRELSTQITREWQKDLLEIIRTQGASRRTTARVMTVGLNVVAVALMIVIFASTGGLTGLEVGVAGASAAVSHKLLEAIFGDQAVRAMTKEAHTILEDRIRSALASVVEDFTAELDRGKSEDNVARALQAVLADWKLR